MRPAREETQAGRKTLAFRVATGRRIALRALTFDGIGSAFVIRNLHHGKILSQSFREFYRVLKPGGHMVHLELSPARRGGCRWPGDIKAYMNDGASGDRLDQSFLASRWPSKIIWPKPIENFPAPRTLCQQMRWAGFERVVPLSAERRHRRPVCGDPMLNLTEYAGLLIYLIIGMRFIGGSVFLASYLVREQGDDPLRRSIYECGMETDRNSVRLAEHSILCIRFGLRGVRHRSGFHSSVGGQV